MPVVENQSRKSNQVSGLSALSSVLIVVSQPERLAAQGRVSSTGDGAAEWSRDLQRHVRERLTRWYQHQRKLTGHV